MADHMSRAIDLLTDIVFASTYPQAEIDKEVEVVCDEIESYNDSPAELIYDEYENILFAHHPLGHAILGEASQLHTYTTADALRFARRHYRPENAVFFISGPSDGSPRRLTSVVGMLERAFGRLDSDRDDGGGILPARAIAPDFSERGGYHTRDRGTHQAHVVVGCRAFDMHDDRRIALFLLNNILGGPAMNSRLNMALRERRGLVYTVESSMAAYSDTGLWATYFGCDAADVKHCLRLVRHELDRLMDRPLSETQLRTAKRQIKGQMSIAADNRENFAIDMAKNFLYGGWESDLDRLLERIDALTAAEMHDVARLLFDEQRITTLVYR